MFDYPLIVRRISEVIINPQVCQVKPQYVDPNTGTEYAYCSQDCQATEAASQQAQYSQQAQHPQQQGDLPPTFTLPSIRLIHPLATGTCRYTGCTLPATLQDGSGWDYCGQSHKLYANTRLYFKNQLTT
jgi:hypothetical protein